ncbi:alpha/beta fold hydrolase [Actinoplanes derwentensis]|uniref:Pimeloyl-ACP methyl ester carboxylesterase n=1 Tax=Actinoplanes derwentensis TaxID=113562 RepID=A0A1H1UWI5_9ACTN|nr:alpha/beta hydrolase [Actinoplanes derwentensis]GID88898.1 alpha/beta hydrolase [Actinoplanes derwentensis]SDS76887.1 Pimeloyl-ACP methyl ester carboxylesterase [Actinoplanes derwentensis]
MIVHSLTVPGIGAVEVTVTERGAGRPVLLLHGGGGPFTVESWADRFAGAEHARVFTPIHPGFNGTPRPEGLDTIGGLAITYAALLEALDLEDVTVVGNSIGGWITAELALLNSPRVSRYVLVDAVGIVVDGHPVADFFSLTMAEVAKLSYHDPATYGIDPAELAPPVREAMAGNRLALGVYSGAGMGDPTLAGRLSAVTGPALVVWGEADRIGDPDYGRAYAAAIPGADFVLIPQSGHLPQIETPDALIKIIGEFAGTHATGM